MLKLLTFVGLLILVPHVRVQARTFEFGLANGLDIRVSYLAEAEGSLVLDENVWKGYLVRLLTSLQSDMGFRIVETNITKSSANSNRYSDCVTDLINNVTDMCLGSLWQTPGRSRRIRFSHAYDQADFRLLVRIVQESASYFEQTFVPFEYEFWGLLVGVTVVMAGTLWVVEGGGEELELDFKGCLHSWWLSIEGLMTGGVAHSPQTVAGKLISTGYTFLILIVLAAYTANLAAFLTVQMAGAEFKSLQDIADKDAAVCMTKHVEPVLAAQYPSVTVVKNVNDLASLEQFRNKGCQALILKQAEFEAIREGDLCSLEFAGGSIFTIPIALGLRVNLSWAPEVDYHIDKYRFEGKLVEWITTDRKKLSCPAIDASDAESSRLKIQQMSGGLGVCAIFWCLGCLAFACERMKTAKETHCKEERDLALEESSPAEQANYKEEADKLESIRNLSELLRATIEQQKSFQAEQEKCKDDEADKFESIRNLSELLRATMEQQKSFQAEQEKCEDEADKFESMRKLNELLRVTTKQNHLLQVTMEQHRSEINMSSGLGLSCQCSKQSVPPKWV